MSDLSWLNPTPHAIAVYASSPLSPVATQHSLPSGRYSLLGPDFHRLDRTSLRLAHSFDHLVGTGKHGRRNFEAKRLRSLEVDYQLVFGWRLHREVGRFLALEDAIDIGCCLPVGLEHLNSIRRQAAACDEVAERIDRRQAVLGGERDDRLTIRCGEEVWQDEERAIGCADKLLDLALHLGRVVNRCSKRLQGQ